MNLSTLLNLVLAGALATVVYIGMSQETQQPESEWIVEVEREPEMPPVVIINRPPLKSIIVPAPYEPTVVTKQVTRRKPKVTKKKEPKPTKVYGSWLDCVMTQMFVEGKNPSCKP